MSQKFASSASASGGTKQQSDAAAGTESTEQPTDPLQPPSVPTERKKKKAGIKRVKQRPRSPSASETSSGEEGQSSSRHRPSKPKRAKKEAQKEQEQPAAQIKLGKRKSNSGNYLKKDLQDFFPECSKESGSHLTRSFTRRIQGTVETGREAETGTDQSSSTEEETSKKKKTKPTRAAEKKTKKRTTGNQQSGAGRSRKSSVTGKKKHLLAEDTVNPESLEGITAPDAESKAGTTGSCSSSSCLVGVGRSNSVYPRTENSGNMAESNNPDNPLGDLAGAQGGLGADGSDPNGDQMEMGRLQAILEARGLPGHIWGALGPRMQSLLGRHPQQTPNSKIQPLLLGIQKLEDESQQLQSVIELCNILVMGNEETLGSQFPVKEVVRGLVQLLQMEHNFDVMNHACRAITYLMEALPRSTPVVVEAIPQLIERLHRIECMDVAEQALTALELLSRRHAKSILIAGGISACLSYLDFFSLVPQRTALQIAANCCSQLSSDEFHYVKDNLGLLTQRLLVQDKKSAESVCTLFTRLVDNFLGHPDKLRVITEQGLLKNVQQLVAVSPPLISTSIFVSIIRMVHLLCAHCTELAVDFLKHNGVGTLRYLLVGSADTISTDIELVARTPQELHEIVVLIGEMMPRLPKDGVFEVDGMLRRQPTVTDHVVWSWKDDRGLWRPYTTMDSRILEAAYQARETEVNLNAMGNTYTVDLENMMQINDDTGTSRHVHRRVSPAAQHSGVTLAVKESSKDSRLEILEMEPKVHQDFIRSLFPVLYEVYIAAAGPAIRHECLRSILRMVFHSDSELLKDVLKTLSVSSHIANMLSSNDMKIVVGAVQLSYLLLEKVPDIFSVYFRREGVLHQVERLTNLPSPPITASETPLKSVSDPHLPTVGAGPAEARNNVPISVVGSNSSSSVSVVPGLVPSAYHAPPLSFLESSRISLGQENPLSAYYGLIGANAAAAQAHRATEVNANIDLTTLSSCRYGATLAPPDGAKRSKEETEESGVPGKGSVAERAKKDFAVKTEEPSEEPMDTNQDPDEVKPLASRSSKSSEQSTTESGRSSTTSITTRYSKRRTNSLSQETAGAPIPARTSRPSSGVAFTIGGSSKTGSRRRSIGSDSANSLLTQGPLANVTVLTRSKAKSMKHTTSASGASALLSASRGASGATSSARRSNSTDPAGNSAKGAPAAKKSIGGSAIMSTLGHIFSRKSTVGSGPPAGNGTTAASVDESNLSVASRKSGATSHHAAVNYLPTASMVPPGGMARFFSMTSNSAYQHLVSNAQLSAYNSVNKEKVRQWIRDHAKELRNTYFESGNANSGDQDGTNVLNKLSRVAEDLLVSEVDLGTKPLEDLKTTVLESDVSSFEILHSGLIGALIKYLTNDEHRDGLSSPRKDRDSRLRRFASVFLNVKQSREKGYWKVSINREDGELPALGRLVTKLNACLNQIEQFPVKVHDLPGGPQGSLRGSNALRFFHTHQIKCMLRRHTSCKDLKEWHRGPIKVDPLAQISAIERYMLLKGYGRVRQGDSHEEDSSDDGGSDEDLEEVLAMGGALGGQHRIRFLINERELPYEMTLYQAVRQLGLLPHGNSTDTDTDTEMAAYGYAAIWVNTHTLWYRLVEQENDGSGKNTKNSSCKSLNNSPDSKNRKSPSSKDKKSPKSSDPLWNEGMVPERVCPLKEYLTEKLPTLLEDPATECLVLLRVLYGLNRYWWALYQDQLLLSYSPIVALSEFVNPKLAAKVNRQLQDPLTVLAQQIPNWIRQLAFASPFILPFESRQSLFYAVAFDRDRALQRLLDTIPDLANQTEAGGERIAPRLERRKMCIHREDLLKQAEHVLSNMDGSSRAVLEIQYQNEEGTGLGPTLEFYALVSKELQKYKLDLWRGEKLEVKTLDGLDEFVFNGHGLYPQVISRGAKQTHVSKVNRKFQFIGRLLARALTDSRMVDLPFSPLFYKWLLGQEHTLCLADLANLEPVILRSLQTVVSPEGGSKEMESMDLDFTLPGSVTEMRKGGKDLTVTMENSKQYVRLVAHWILYEGVAKQMEAMVEGFEKIVPLRHLKMFYPEEMEQLFCGSRQDSSGGSGHWEANTILQYIRPDHGYNHDSQPIQWLVQTMASFTLEQQRRFLHFITGSPKLPVGGFKSLNPPLTVVRKGTEGAENPDQFLPSVMTCVNYLKLPEYSSLEVMKERLETAMRWGQKSFHLS